MRVLLDVTANTSVNPTLWPRQMWVYTVWPNHNGSAEQASMPIVIPVLMPWTSSSRQTWGKEIPREDDITAGEEGESERSEEREGWRKYQ